MAENTPVDPRSKRLRKSTPDSPAAPDRGRKRSARRRAIAKRFSDDDSGKAWLE